MTEIDIKIKKLIAKVITKITEDKIPDFLLQPARDSSQGDIAANIAFLLAKNMKMPPQVIATKIATELTALKDVQSDKDFSEIHAKSGFLNFRLSNFYWGNLLKTIILQGDKWGKIKQNSAEQERINIEFISANPTGPLHIGHARLAVVGDVLANLLEYCGAAVTREYYVNDGGAQIESLTRSLLLRMKQETNEEPKDTIPEYPGEYLADYAKALIAQGETTKASNLDEKVVAMILEDIKKDLTSLGVSIDRFSSEKALIEDGSLERFVEDFKKRGLIYKGKLKKPKSDRQDARNTEEEREQWLLKASDFGDTTDRSLFRKDGSPTYFAVDAAYHLDKAKRLEGKGDLLIDVLGAGHDGYVARVSAVLQASGKGRLQTVMCQIVRVLKGGKSLVLSKRAGNIVTLKEMLEAVGKDVLRFALITRGTDTPLEIDTNKIVAQSKDNVVFYVHYAHARLASLERRAKEEAISVDISSFDASLLTSPFELNLIRILSDWPRQVLMARSALEPHRLCVYLAKVASAVHELWSHSRQDPSTKFLIKDKPEQTKARLALAKASKSVIKSGLDIFGVRALDEL